MTAMLLKQKVKNLGNNLREVHVGLQAGCCVVRTSSGDWAEACAQEEQRVQEEQRAQQAHSSQTPATTPKSTSAPARYRSSCFRAACLGDEADDGEYEPLQDQAQGPEASLIIQLPNHSSDTSEQLSNVLEHHVPAELQRSIR